MISGCVIHIIGVNISEAEPGCVPTKGKDVETMNYELRQYRLREHGDLHA